MFQRKEPAQDRFWIGFPVEFRIEKRMWGTTCARSKTQIGAQRTDSGTLNIRALLEIPSRTRKGVGAVTFRSGLTLLLIILNMHRAAGGRNDSAFGYADR